MFLAPCDTSNIGVGVRMKLIHILTTNIPEKFTQQKAVMQ